MLHLQILHIFKGFHGIVSKVAKEYFVFIFSQKYNEQTVLGTALVHHI